MMRVSDRRRGEGRAAALLEMEIAIINAPMISRAKIRTVFVLFPKCQGNVFFISQTIEILFGVERMKIKKIFACLVCQHLKKLT